MITVARPEPDRGRTVAALLAEFRSFTDLIAGLDATEWTAPTRCLGWEVRDVAAHVVGQLVDTVTRAVGSRTPDEQAVGLRHRTPAELAADLRAGTESFALLTTMFDDANWVGPSLIPGITLGQGVQALLNDAYVHADDIRAAVGKPFDNGPGLYASLDFVLGALIRSGVASGEPGIAGLLAIPACGFTVATGIAARDFVLAATGRLDAAQLGLPEAVNIFR